MSVGGHQEVHYYVNLASAPPRNSVLLSTLLTLLDNHTHLSHKYTLNTWKCFIAKKQ